MVDVHLFVFDALYLIVPEHRQGALQRPYIGTLAATGGPDDHEPVAHADHLIQFDVLLDEDGHGLEALLVDGVLQRSDQWPIIEGRPVSRKLQVVLQLGVSRGRSAVLLSQYGLIYVKEVVAEFGPLRWL